MGEIKTSNKKILLIIKRAFLKKYSKNLSLYSEFQKTSLSSEEILEINNIKSELENIFSLNSNFSKKFIIEEIKEKKEILEINYNHKDNFIEIIPFLDYGIKKIPISDSVKFQKKGLQHSFTRKFNDELGIDYLIKIENEKII
ncbi:MAG TPA: hypothetical protein EYG72_03055 [Candidatus Pacebacteria bacterium]|nr:hypothetical protein [Candidatus Paceibacterota bacterium]HIP33157.1 hypothetical protein [Bacteroidia bacterium]